MERSCIPLLVRNPCQSFKDSACSRLEPHRKRPKVQTRTPRPKPTAEIGCLSRPETPSPLDTVSTVTNGLLTPPVSPPDPPGTISKKKKHFVTPFTPKTLTTPQRLPITPPYTPRSKSFSATKSPTPVPNDSTSRSPTPDWTSSPSIKSILAGPPASIVRPIRPFRPTLYNVTEAPPPEDGINRSRRCLQCEMLGLRCDKKLPACSRCARRLHGAALVAFAHGREADVGEEVGETRAGQGNEPCLAMRISTEAERQTGQVKGRAFQVVLGRVKGDSEAIWKRKLELREDLLDVEKQRACKANWALPMPVARGIMNGEEMWRRVSSGQAWTNSTKGDW